METVGRRRLFGFGLALGVIAPTVAIVGCGAGRTPALHCNDGTLPCADQITAIHCETLTDGLIPPDLGEVKWMLDGAHIPQRGEPELSLTEWCSGTLDAAGLHMPIELFVSSDGGYLQVPGRDRVWFEAPPEDASAKHARTCVAGELPHGVIDSMTCKAAVGRTLPPNHDAWIARLRESAIVGEDTFYGGGVHLPVAACEGTTDVTADMAKNNPALANVDLSKPLRVDLFQGDRGWIHLPGERRLCFMAKSP